MKRILVTGGAGFIGSHTVDFFLQQKACQVVVLDNLTTGKIAHLDLMHSNLRLVQADILDYAILAKEIALCDVVLHLAALPSVLQSIEDPVQSLTVNTQGFLHVLQAIRKSQKDIRLIYASSAAVYGANTSLPCSDELPLSMTTLLSPYALDKVTNEHYADLYARLFGIKSLGLRYFNVYGARQASSSPYSGVIAKFVECYQKKSLLTIFGDGEQSRDFIHVADVARANWLAAQSNYCGILNIATGVPQTLMALVDCMEAVGGYAAQVKFTAPRVSDILQSYASITKAQDHLQYRSAIALAEGIRLLLGNNM
jgi:UDP-glucose 4-epimerase